MEVVGRHGGGGGGGVQSHYGVQVTFIHKFPGLADTTLDHA